MKKLSIFLLQGTSQGGYGLLAPNRDTGRGARQVIHVRACATHAKLKAENRVVEFTWAVSFGLGPHRARSPVHLNASRVVWSETTYVGRFPYAYFQYGMLRATYQM